MARLGGDEFGLLLENCPAENAIEVAQGLIIAVREFRFVWQAQAFNIGVSIGLVQINAATQNMTQLMSQADVACYTAKDLGRNRLHVYQVDDVELANRHREIHRAAMLTDALREQRFRLYKQPIRALCSTNNAAESYELLLRLEDAGGELLLPGAFIPPAERYGIMPSIDRWVIEKALQHPLPISKGRPPARISINLSGSSLNDASLLDFIDKQLDASAISPDRICFEITETAAINHLSKAAQFMAQVKEFGCRFALDDFGKGLSSFTYLRDLPVDYLKINGSFVQGMIEDPVDEAMVAAINQLGHVIGLKTIAEYAETPAIVEQLRKLGIDYAQGYAIGEPQPI
ncbi:MAG: EAL domain-containing protein [Gammaproteobacteria bacterium]|nr:EAL domain-containing protein [Gammaproteobacteria bacterium]